MASIRVIIPCYNYAHYLPAAVESALDQPDVEVSVLIIDDASTDDSAAVATQLAERDQRVEFIRHATNKGHIATYNEGLASTRTDYLALLSADDLLTPGALKRATDLMEAHPSVGLVYGHPIVFRDDEGRPPPRSGRHTRTVWNGRNWLERMCGAGHNFIYCPEVVMRTSTQHRIGGYDPKLPQSGDMEMWLRAASVADVGRINGADQAYYRVHRTSMQRTVHKGAIADIEARVAAFDSALAKSGLPDTARLRDLAHASVAVLAVRDLIVSLQGADQGPTPEAEALAALARTVDPAVASTPEWRTLQGLLAGRKTWSGAAPARLRHDLQSRLGWHYWRWRGLVWPVRSRPWNEVTPSMPNGHP